MKKKQFLWDRLAVGLLRKTDIFLRIFLVTSFVSVFPIFFLSIISFREYVSEVRDNTQKYLSILTQNLANQVDLTLNDYEDLSRIFYTKEDNITKLAQNLALVETEENPFTHPEYLENKREIEETLLVLASTHRDIINISFLTPHDQYTMRPENSGTYGAIVQDLEAFHQSALYQGAIDRQGYAQWYDTTQEDDFLYKFHYSSSGIANTFTLTTAVYQYPEKVFLGVLMININANLFQNHFPTYSFHDAGNTFLLTENQVLEVLNVDFSAPNTNSVAEIFQDIFQEDSGSFTSRDDRGREVFVVHHQSQKLPIHVTHIVDMENLLQPAYGVRNQVLTWVLGLLLFCVVLARFTSLSISLPLRKLLCRMEAFRHDFSILEEEVTGQDQLTTVGNYFNDMAKSTQELLEEIVATRTREKNLELSHVTAQLNALQMQINPHFMYNTLDIIRWHTIAVGGGENEASKMIDKFCKLMRMSVIKGENYVSLASELDHVRAYLDVVNLGNTKEIALETTIDFDKEQYKIPKLTLQPLVENSVVHGFRKDSENPQIHIRGFDLPDHLMLTVTDNGKGMNPQQVAELIAVFSSELSTEENIGIRNVNHRFILSYGDNYGITLESFEDIGTELTLRFPKHQNIEKG